MDNMEAFIAQAQALASTVDDAGRQKILDTLRDTQYSIEKPYDTLQRLSCLVSTFPQGHQLEKTCMVHPNLTYCCQHLQIAGARLGIDLSIFEALASDNIPLSVADLAVKCRAAPELLGITISSFIISLFTSSQC